MTDSRYLEESMGEGLTPGNRRKNHNKSEIEDFMGSFTNTTGPQFVRKATRNQDYTRMNTVGFG